MTEQFTIEELSKAIDTARAFLSFNGENDLVVRLRAAADRLIKQETELAMSNDVAAKGELARFRAMAMEEEIKDLKKTLAEKARDRSSLVYLNESTERKSSELYRAGYMLAVAIVQSELSTTLHGEARDALDMFLNLDRGSMEDHRASKSVYAGSANTGHGHVHIRSDGAKARCGGPGICVECSLELSRSKK